MGISQRKGLSKPHAQFVAAYLSDKTHNATAAYLHVYPTCSPAAARANASRLLTQANIRAAIQGATKAVTKKAEITLEDTLRGISRIANSDLRKLFDGTGRFLPPKDWPDDIAAAVAGFEVVTKNVPGSDPVEVEHVVKIKLWDKNKALELAGKHLRIFEEPKEGDGDRLPVVIIHVDPRLGQRRALPKPAAVEANFFAVAEDLPEVDVAPR